MCLLVEDAKLLPTKMIHLNALKQKTQLFNVEVYALYLSYRDVRVHWYVRTLIAFAIGYAVSPIDFIPDLVPVLGFLDDVVVVPLTFHLSYQLISKNVRDHSRLLAFEVLSESSEKSTVEAYRIVQFTWLLISTLAAIIFYKFLSISFI
jgi:uncharacterized membrane protein YkvA (DUF1232 family)